MCILLNISKYATYCINDICYKYLFFLKKMIPEAQRRIIRFTPRIPTRTRAERKINMPNWVKEVGEIPNIFEINGIRTIMS